jgi:spermidine synthase
MNESKHSSGFSLVCLCLGLSGLAGLIYQTAWARQFALVFGTSEAAVASVLAAFMAGLALGAGVVEMLLRRIKRPLHLYAALELGIALSATVIVPGCLALLERLLVILVGHQAAPPSAGSVGSTAFYVAGAFAALMIPTAFMGATLPLIVRFAVQTQRQIGRRVGLLYAWNTAGAVAGSLVCAFILLPRIGLSRTVWAAAGLNTMVCILALVLLRTAGRATLPADDPERPCIVAAPPGAVWVLPLILLSGVVSFLHEVLWTRLLGHLLGSSLHAFAVMLASFLAGIALGGASGAYLGRDRKAAANWFVIGQFCTAVTAAGAWVALTAWAPADGGFGMKIVFSFALLLPMAFSIGLSYPLAVRVLAADVENAAPASARVYRWNTIGCVAGALLGAFLIIPGLRYEGALRIAVDASMVLGAAACFLPGLSRRRLVMAGAATVICLLLFYPSVPTKLLKSSLLSGPVEGELFFYDVGSSSDVVVIRRDNGLLLQSNGLPEAVLDTPSTVPQLDGESWMAPLAVLARPRAENLLIVGYGSGRTIQETPASVAAIDVVELEPKVIDANRAASPLRTWDPLSDDRVTIIENDARGALLLTDKRYDLVISQPSHPWTAGASHLYTREFACQVRNHLTPEGVFVQWSNLFYLDEELLRSMAATLLDVFSHVRLYRPGSGTLIFLASDSPITPEITFSEIASGQAPSSYQKLGIGSTEDLVAALVLDTRAAAAFTVGATPITDDDNRLATTLVHDLDRGLNDRSAGALLASCDVLQDPESFVYRDMKDLNFGYIGSYLKGYVEMDPSVVVRMGAMACALGTGDQAVYLAALAASYSEGPEKDNLHGILLEALKRFPDSGLLRFKAIQPYFSGVVAGTASADVLDMAAALPEEAAMVMTAVANANRGAWGELAAMDARLAGVSPTAPWAFNAAQMRAEWRVRVGNQEMIQGVSEEALDIIDPWIVRFPTIPMLLLRTWTAYRAGSPEAALGSISALVKRVVDTGEQLGAGQRASLGKNMKALSSLIDALADQETVDTKRLEAVRSALDDAIAGLSSSK